MTWAFDLDALLAELRPFCSVRVNELHQEFDGLPPWSVEATVEAGNEQRVAEVLAHRLPIGILTLGDCELPVLVGGFERRIRYRRKERDGVVVGGITWTSGGEVLSEALFDEAIAEYES